MKLFFLTTIQFLIGLQVLGQTFFEADGKEIKTGTICTAYNFSYSFSDSLTLFFGDSVVQYFDTKKTIVKTVTYYGFNKSSEPSIKLEYFGTNGRDSISKHFNDGRPSMTYQTNYDNIGRIIYYGMRDYNADSTHDRGFEWFYEYRDSSISTGKIEIQTIFVDDAYGDKRVHFRVLNEYDNKNRKVKESPESQSNDPYAQVITYLYNEKDSLISERVDGMETLLSREKHLNTMCDIENEYLFTTTDFNSIKQLTLQLLLDNTKLFTTDLCENYFLTLISTDKQTRLTLVKRKPYHCEGRQVYFSTTQTLR